MKLGIKQCPASLPRVPSRQCLFLPCVNSNANHLSSLGNLHDSAHAAPQRRHGIITSAADSAEPTAPHLTHESISNPESPDSYPETGHTISPVQEGVTAGAACSWEQLGVDPLLVVGVKAVGMHAACLHTGSAKA